MPDIDLLQPIVLRGVVNLTQPPRTLLGTQLLNRTPYPFPNWKYDVIKNNRNLALPNVPNAEANVVKQLTIGQVAGSFIYVREKKVLEATTMYWLREPGQIAQANATRKVSEEIRDLNLRTERFVEYCIWSMFSGSLTLAKNNVVASIDFQIQTSHKPTSAVLWSDLTNATVEIDLRAWKRLIARDSFWPATNVVSSELTMGYITQNKILRNNNFLSDRMKEQIATGDQWGPLFGLTYNVYDIAYVDDSGVEQRFIPDGKVLIYGSDNNPFELLEGPTADTQAPQGFTGKFSKSWEMEDPSARQLLIEYNFMPILQRPDQVVWATVA